MKEVQGAFDIINTSRSMIGKHFKFLAVSLVFIWTLQLHSQYDSFPSYDLVSLASLGMDYQPRDPLFTDYLTADQQAMLDVAQISSPWQDDVKIPWAKTDTGKSLIISGALIGVGLFTYKDSGFLNRVDVKDNVNRYLPHFENALDDYTQYIPFVAAYALDPLGVKSKHKLFRKTTTTATAIASNLIVIQGLKYSIAETRPDGSSNNAFPSGHTATAFMGAHILHKEYGDRSIYYSVGAYTLATITGIFRQLNDRHWISDVFVGAGLGISLTEFSYWLNNRWWGNEGVNEIEIIQKAPNRGRPSYLGIKFGYAGLLNQFNDPESGVSAQSGFTLGVDGAWFFSKHIGIGGETGFQSFPISLDQSVIDEAQNEGYDIQFQAMGNSKSVFGPHFQLSWNKSMVGVKFLAGWANIADTQVLLQELEGDEPSEADDLVYLEIAPVTNFAWSTGLYYRWLIGNRLALNVFVDYNDTDLDSTIRYIEELDADGVPIYAQDSLIAPFNSITAGISFNVMIW